MQSVCVYPIGGSSGDSSMCYGKNLRAQKRRLEVSSNSKTIPAYCAGTNSLEVV